MPLGASASALAVTLDAWALVAFSGKPLDALASSPALAASSFFLVLQLPSHVFNAASLVAWALVALAGMPPDESVSFSALLAPFET